MARSKDRSNASKQPGLTIQRHGGIMNQDSQKQTNRQQHNQQNYQQNSSQMQQSSNTNNTQKQHRSSSSSGKNKNVDSSWGNNSTRRGCRDCGGNHRTSKCPETSLQADKSQSSRRHNHHNRSRSRSPGRNDSQRKQDRDGRKHRGRRHSSSPSSPRPHSSSSKNQQHKQHHHNHHRGSSHRPSSSSKTAMHRSSSSRHNKESERKQRGGNGANFNEGNQHNLTPMSKENAQSKDHQGSRRNKSRRHGGKRSSNKREADLFQKQNSPQQQSNSKNTSAANNDVGQHWNHLKEKQNSNFWDKEDRDDVNESEVKNSKLSSEAQQNQNMTNDHENESSLPLAADQTASSTVGGTIQHMSQHVIQKPSIKTNKKDETFEEPSHDQNLSDEEDNQDLVKKNDQSQQDNNIQDKDDDADESSSNYSSSSQSSGGENHHADDDDDAMEDEIDDRIKDRKDHHLKNSKTDGAYKDVSKNLAVGQKATSKKVESDEDEQYGTLEHSIFNDDKLDSISSLFLSEKDDINSCMVGGRGLNLGKKNNKSLDQHEEKSGKENRQRVKVAEEGVDDIDKLSSPGKNRTKPKSINSPSQLKPTLHQANALLQSLTQQSEQIGGIQQQSSSQQNMHNKNNSISNSHYLNSNGGKLALPHPHPHPHQMLQHSDKQSQKHNQHHSQQQHHMQNLQPQQQSYYNAGTGNGKSQYNSMNHHRHSGNSNHATSSNFNNNSVSRHHDHHQRSGSSSYNHSNQHQTNSSHQRGSSSHNRYSNNNENSSSYHNQQNSTYNRSHNHHQNQNHSNSMVSHYQDSHQNNMSSSAMLTSSATYAANGLLGHQMTQSNSLNLPPNNYGGAQYPQNNAQQNGSGPGTVNGSQTLLQNIKLQGIGDLTNYEESVRRLENTPDALAQKTILRKCSIKGAKFDVRLFVGQVPRIWKDENIMNYFKKFGTVLEARIIRDKYEGTHRGCAFLKCQNFHEAENILDGHPPKLKNENGAFIEDPKRRNSSCKRLRNNNEGTQDQCSNDEDERARDERIAGRLQVRYADGELERLGIVNLESQEQSKLYCSNISKSLNQESVTELFQTFGDVEELYLFRDQQDNFRGSCFIKYETRKQALKAVLYLNRKGAKDNKYSDALVDKDLDVSANIGQLPEGVPVLDIRFADKKRKENFSLIYQTQQNQQILKQWQVNGNQQQQRGMNGNNNNFNNNGNFQRQQSNNNQYSNNGYRGGKYNNNYNGGNENGSSYHNGSYGGNHKSSQQQYGSHMQQHNEQHQNNNSSAAMASYQGGSQSAAAFQQAVSQDHGAAMQQQLMLGPLQIFLRSLLIDPAKQHLFLEYFSQENGGKPYYLDTHTNVSQWQKPMDIVNDPLTGAVQNSVILNGTQVNEQMKQWLSTSDGQKAVQNFNNTQQQKSMIYSLDQGQSQSYQSRGGAKGQYNNNGGDNQSNSYQGQQGYNSNQQDHQQHMMLNGGPQGNTRAINLITQGLYKQGPTGANLFIFHLPNEWSDLDLFYFFESFKLGPIVSVRIMTDKQSGRSKGFGFVSYDNPQSAEEAIRKINGKQALGKRLKVELKKGGIATHLGGDVSLTKEDNQIIRQNMDQSGDENSNNSSLWANNHNHNRDRQSSQTSQWDSKQNNNRGSKRYHSFAGQGRRHERSESSGSQQEGTGSSAAEKMMQQILGGGKHQSKQADSLASMTNLIYEGTTGVNDEVMHQSSETTTALNHSKGVANNNNSSRH